MAIILNIETSGPDCSVALTADGSVLKQLTDRGRNHAEVLSGFIKNCLDHLSSHELKLNAVAVSLGPGSYTGLRIGLSEAKGLAYALDIPLIGVDTLKLLATQVMFEEMPEADTIFIPMIDARRMEIYTAAYDMTLTPLAEPHALILDEGSYSDIRDSGRPVLFFGSGADKAREIMESNANVRFVSDIVPLASGMTALAEQAFMRRDFIDVAYSTPLYLKDFQATKPKNKVL